MLGAYLVFVVVVSSHSSHLNYMSHLILPLCMNTKLLVSKEKRTKTFAFDLHHVILNNDNLSPFC